MRRKTGRFRNLFPHHGEQPESRYFKITVYALFGIVLLSVVAGLGTFLLSLRGREEVLVPEIRQEQLSDALVELQERDLYSRIQLRYHSDPTLKGKVVEQDPAAGSLVRAGKEVELTVSQGSVVDRVGNYVGQTLEEVRDELSTLFTTFDAVLQIGDVSYVYSDEPTGTILEQDPEADTEISGTTELDLVVSRGEDVEQVSVPSYAGLDYQEAVELLSQEDIPFVFSLAEDSDAGSGGIVVDQEPAAGEEVPAGTRVELTMVPPTGLDDSVVFGIFEQDLPDYPVAVDMTLEAIGPDGDREVIFSMEHPGGEMAVPYAVEENTRLVLSRFDTEVLSEQVRPAEQDGGQSSGSTTEDEVQPADEGPADEGPDGNESDVDEPGESESAENEPGDNEAGASDDEAEVIEPEEE
ncbi:MAG: PASTA domain-containing protein [Spirochaetota bacterium]